MDAALLSTTLLGRVRSAGFNVQPDSLGRALQAARRAADAAPSNALAHNALARAPFFAAEFQAFRTAAERTIALNPMDGGTVAFMGVLISYSGDWDHGCAMVERAAELNPRHPGWYHVSSLLQRVPQTRLRRGARSSLKINLPAFLLHPRRDRGGVRTAWASARRRPKPCESCVS